MLEPLPIIDEFLPMVYARALTQLLYFIIAFVIVFFGGRAVLMPIIDRFLSKRDIDEHARRPIKRLTSVAVTFIAVAVAFGFADYGNFLTSLATIGAAATLAIGFAMQDVIANFVAGVFIYTDKPFRIGDWISWDDHEGIVEDISLRVSRVRTFDNELLTVPNSLLTDGVIKNPVANDSLRVQFEFGIGYDDDIQKATDIIIEEARAHDDILDDPEPSVVLSQLADSYVGLTSRIWIDEPSRANFLRIRGEYITNVKAAFDRSDIEIPFPQRDLSGGIELTNASMGRTEGAESTDG